MNTNNKKMKHLMSLASAQIVLEKYKFYVNKNEFYAMKILTNNFSITQVDFLTEMDFTQT